MKFVRYNGFNPPNSSAVVAYKVKGNIVIFTAVENVVVKTSTINAAEEIIRKICEAENLDYRNYEFYDLQTWVGYPHRGEGYYCLDFLLIGLDEIKVMGWESVFNSDEMGPHQPVVTEFIRLLTKGK